MEPATVLIGLDGATFTILDPLMQRGLMPFLAQFIRSGVRADLRTIIPALTPPAWTSLVTGISPGKHGIFDFFRRQSAQDHNVRFVTSRDIRGQTIWDVASDHDLRSMALNFPLTYPAPPIDGYVVPGWMPWRQLRLGCHPANLYDRLKSIPEFNPRELGMDMSHEEIALEGGNPEEYEEWIAWHIRRELQWFRILKRLMQEEPPCRLISILFDGMDKLQHLFWRFIVAHEQSWSSPWEQRVRAACLDYFRQLDDILAGIVDLAGIEATVVIVSDHGFGPQIRTFFANAWLAEKGYLNWAAETGPQAVDQQSLGIGQIARHGYLLDWQHTRAYAPLPSGNGIHIVQADEAHPAGVPAAEYELFRERLISELLEVADPISGDKVVAEVWRREEIFSGPFLELAPDLTLVLEDAGLLSILDSSEIVVGRPQPTGTHRPEGIFVARGPGLRQDLSLPELSILDVAPLVLYSLGLPVPAEMEGIVPGEAYKPAFWRAQPVRKGERTIPEEQHQADAVAESELDEETKRAVLDRLRSLGYLE